MSKKGKLTVTGHKSIAKDVYQLTVKGELVTQMTAPGQFVHLKVDEGSELLLRRPISICDVNSSTSELTMLYRVDGAGTGRLSGRMIGEEIDVLGPLGTGFPVQETKQGETALLIGGGIGVPPLYYLSKQLKAQGCHVVHILGFQSEKDTFYVDEFSELGQTYVATVDGTLGTKGFVTDVYEQQEISFDTLYSCGPTAMLKALTERFRHKRAYISLEERMGCGVGACFACVCHLEGDEGGTSYRKICTDGPVFPIGEVVL
ncbi:dihydroorotate dehydrogenase electron transfer subunit [Halalkalibacterium ligniniphilum]|uniref:dihydroorotate dehydrogenase electron transfer subunit n=1 Tax=Halalkalibacterium ligniniphilum TaxID=1134413 RepID=UPI00034A97CC|nr:dihydroorotate dehydrogenase electron transfer subunit [Halalkalibacterium ligniniphilum]